MAETEQTLKQRLEITKNRLEDNYDKLEISDVIQEVKSWLEYKLTIEYSSWRVEGIARSVIKGLIKELEG